MKPLKQPKGVPPMVRLTLSLPRAQAAQLKRDAAAADRSVSSYVRRVLQEARK